MKVRALALLYALVVSTSFCFAGDVVTRFRDNSDYGDGTNWAAKLTFGSITTGGQCGSGIFSDSAGAGTCWILDDGPTSSPAYLVIFNSSVSDVQITYSGSGNRHQRLRPSHLRHLQHAAVPRWLSSQRFLSRLCQLVLERQPHLRDHQFCSSRRRLHCDQLFD